MENGNENPEPGTDEFLLKWKRRYFGENISPHLWDALKELEQARDKLDTYPHDPYSDEALLLVKKAIWLVEEAKRLNNLNNFEMMGG